MNSSIPDVAKTMKESGTANSANSTQIPDSSDECDISDSAVVGQSDASSISKSTNSLDIAESSDISESAVAKVL